MVSQPLPRGPLAMRASGLLGSRNLETPWAGFALKETRQTKS
jgi:hypothetical protein